MYWNILTFYIFFAETATFGKTCEAIERHSHYRYILIKTKLFNFTLRCLLERLGVYLDKGRWRLVILSFSTSYSWVAPWIYSVLPKSRHGWNHTGHLTDYCGCILFLNFCFIVSGVLSQLVISDAALQWKRGAQAGWLPGNSVTCWLWCINLWVLMLSELPASNFCCVRATTKQMFCNCFPNGSYIIMKQWRLLCIMS